MSAGTRDHPHYEILSITHPFELGQCVKGCQVVLDRRPIFFRATILKPVPHIADLYEGRLDGEQQIRRFFAHPTWQDAQSEAALLLHYRASLAPETFYETASLFPRSGGTR